MKKTLLLASVIVAGFSFGQKKLVAITNHNFDEMGAITYIDSTTNTYNSGQVGFNEFKPTFKFDYGLYVISTPDEDNKFILHSDIMDNYGGISYPLSLNSTTTNTLVNGKVTLSDDGGSEKVFYAYDSQGNMTMRVIQNFNGATWDTQDSTVYTYDVTGNLIVIEQYDPSSTYPISVDSMFYNAGTNLINKAVNYYYDFGSNSLVASVQSLMSYSGTKVQNLDMYNDNGSGGLDWVTRVTYDYAGNIPTGFTFYLVVNNVVTPSVLGTGTINTNTSNLYSEYNLVFQGDTLYNHKYEYDSDGFLIKRTVYEPDMNNDLYVSSKTAYTYQNTAGIAELDKAKVTVFPNPSINSITIQSESPVKTVRVLNLSGQVVMEQNSSELDIHRLNPGTYILQGTTEKGVFQERVVKQ